MRLATGSGPDPCRDGGIGRRKGLKIPRPLGVRVQVPLPALLNYWLHHSAGCKNTSAKQRSAAGLWQLSLLGFSYYVVRH